jgi:hypothetical protein
MGKAKRVPGKEASLVFQARPLPGAAATNIAKTESPIIWPHEGITFG